MKKVTAICIYKHELEVVCSSWTDKLKEAAKAASFFCGKIKKFAKMG